MDREYILDEIANNFMLADQSTNKESYQNRKRFAVGYMACAYDIGIINDNLYNSILNKVFRKKIDKDIVCAYIGIKEFNWEEAEKKICERFGVATIEEVYRTCMLNNRYTSKVMDVVRIFFAKNLLK